MIVTRPVLQADEDLASYREISPEVRSLFPTGLRCAGEKAGASFMQYCLRPEIGKVEIAPFAYMRGRTFENAVVNSWTRPRT